MSRVEAVEVWTVLVVDILVCGELRSVKLAELRLESLKCWKREWWEGQRVIRIRLDARRGVGRRE